MKRVLYYSQGKIEIFNDFLIKYKLVKNETIVSYFLLVADNYFYRDHYNMSDDQFNYTYHKKFLRLYESSQAYHEELQYSISPIIYKNTFNNISFDICISFSNISIKPFHIHFS
jgi:hypothetical protein